MIKQTLVVSGFPGVGKSYLFRKAEEENLTILDSDSSKFDKSQFPQNYMDHIIENIGKVDIIMVSSHDVVRKALKENRILYNLVYPSIDLKDDYIQRYKERGNDEKFINFISDNWESFIHDIEKEDFPRRVELDSGEYLGDAIDQLIPYTR